MSELDIRPMSLGDLRLATDWAAAEGWNPGLEDAETFHRIDPGGFLMGWLGERPATAISVVAHTDAFGFLGFYLCHPDFRGRGHGLATWQAGLARLGARTIGLDGVPAQEANYRRSGFGFAFRSHRFEGSVPGHTHQTVRQAEPGDLPAILALDAAANGVARTAYLTTWVRHTRTRLTLVHREDDQVTGFATIRTCRNGHKIGPLVAPDADTARALLESLIAAAEAGRIAIDIPEHNAIGQQIARRHGLESSFACARMYRGNAPAGRQESLVAIASFELG